MALVPLCEFNPRLHAFIPVIDGYKADSAPVYCPHDPWHAADCRREGACVCLGECIETETPGAAP